MDLRQLGTLVAIADHGSFSAAARALFTVQSNVSAHIAKLERELGAVLIERSTGELTTEGNLVVERARRILHDIDDIASEIASLDRRVSGEVRIGVIGTVARWLMPGLLLRIGRTHPLVQTVVSEGSTSALLPNVLSGLLHAAIVHLPVDEPELDVEPLFEEGLVLLSPLGHPLAEATDVTMADLADHSLLLPPVGSALRRILDRAAAEVGVVLRSQTEADGVRLLATLAVEGHGPAIVPTTAIDRADGDSIRIATVDGLPQRTVGWVRRRRPNPSPATAGVRSVLHETLSELVPEQVGVHTLG